MVGLVVVSHSAKVADGVVEIAREMAGPDIRIAGAGGILATDSSLALGTDVARICQAIDDVWSDDGVLILVDLGGALLSADMAIDAQPEARRSRIVVGDGPLVEGAIAAVARARAGGTLGEVATEARRGLVPKIEHLTGPVGASLVDASTSDSGSRLRLAVTNPLGLHARPAGRLVQLAASFAGELRVANLRRGGTMADAKSLIALLSLAIRPGDEIEVAAHGPGAEAVLTAIAELARAGFGEAAGSSPRAGAEVPAPDLSTSETVLAGLGAVAGQVFGPVFWLSPSSATTTNVAGNPDAEWAAVVKAVGRVRADLAQRRQGEGMSAVGRDILAVQELLLQDQTLLAAVREAIFRDQQPARPAWDQAIRFCASRLRATDDPLVRERAVDVDDVGRQVASYLQGASLPSARPTQPCVVFADELFPSEVATFNPSIVRGVAAASGAPTSHAAILLRAARIPTVVGVGPRLRSVSAGTLALIDGTAGKVVANPANPPGPSVRLNPAGQTDSTSGVDVGRWRDVARTRGGPAIRVEANVSSRADALAAARAGADGVGLLRTELLFADRASPPSEDEQLAAYAEIVRAMAGCPVTIRTFDAGGDKPLPFVANPPEVNPALGCRGLRLSLAHPDLFQTQLRAIARSASEGPVRIMFPMVATLGELRAARRQLELARDDLKRRGIEPAALVGVGIMVEIPAAVYLMETAAGDLDFVSLGTNDLAQYAMAADRDNPAVASLADALQPAVLKLVQQAAGVGQRAGIAVAVCGEVASDPAAVPLLLGLGVGSLSVHPAAVVWTKRTIGQLDDESAKRLAADALREADAANVRQRLNQ